MSHEILFRGERVDNGKLFIGDGIQYPKSDKYKGTCWIGGIEGNNDWVQVIPETLERYTGLHDSTKWDFLPKSEQQDWLKNHTVDEWKGKKIFEGDIIKHNVMYSEGKTIKREDQIFVIRYSIKQTRFLAYLSNGVFNPTAMQHCEVIGNIHDNPELLKGETESGQKMNGGE